MVLSWELARGLAGVGVLYLCTSPLVKWIKYRRAKARLTVVPKERRP